MTIFIDEREPSWDMKLFETAICALYTAGFILFCSFVLVKNFVPDPPQELSPDPALQFVTPVSP